MLNFHGNVEKYSWRLITLLLCLIITGCAPQIPEDALKLSPETLEQRTLQTRKYEGISEKKLLAASVGIIQDLGFDLDESETDLGVVVGSKNRDASEVGQMIVSILLASLTGTVTPVDKEQKIRVALVIRPATEDNDKSHFIRISFQRIVWNTQGDISKIESINEPEIYQQFFSSLSKSVFLEAQEI